MHRIHHTNGRCPSFTGRALLLQADLLKEGLPSTVRCILTDEQGFVWIGTRSGLGRFDGHELKKYTHQANDPHSLPHDLILQIVEDRQYNIWILTDKGWHATSGKVTISTCQPMRKGKILRHIPPVPPRTVFYSEPKTRFTFITTGTPLSTCCRNLTRRTFPTSTSQFSAFGTNTPHFVAAGGKVCSCST